MSALIPREFWEHHFTDSIGAILKVKIRQNCTTSIDIPGVGDTLPTRSGRSALVVALKALGLPLGARIGIPLYCCPVVSKAVQSAGFTPFYLDIDPRTYCLSVDYLTEKVEYIDALIAVHMFGNTCALKDISRIMAGKPIIEDCAQSIGSTYDGRTTGVFGKISFFSFRSGKYISAGEGGALFSSDSQIRLRIEQVAGQLPENSVYKNTRHILITYFKSILRDRPLYGWFGHFLWTYANSAINLSERSKITIGRIMPGDMYIAERRLTRVDHCIARQRRNVELLMELLKVPTQMLCHESEGTVWNRQQFPLSFSSQEERDKMAALLLQNSIDTTKYLDGCVSTAEKLYGYSGGCPVSERLSKMVLTIPCYHSLSESDMRRIAMAINAAWEIVSSGKGFRLQNEC